jgi:hypothetical protein
MQPPAIYRTMTLVHLSNTSLAECLDTLNMIVKEMWALKPEDNRELMQSRSLIKDCCAMRIDLLSSATVVDRAVKFVDRHRDLIPQNNEVVVDHHW